MLRRRATFIVSAGLPFKEMATRALSYPASPLASLLPSLALSLDCVWWIGPLFCPNHGQFTFSDRSAPASSDRPWQGCQDRDSCDPGADVGRHRPAFSPACEGARG